MTASGHLVYVTDRTRDEQGYPNALIVRTPSGLEDVLQLERYGLFLSAASNPGGIVRAVLHDSVTARLRFAGPGLLRDVTGSTVSRVVHDVELPMGAFGQNGCLIRWDAEKHGWRIYGMRDAVSFEVALVNDAGEFLEVPALDVVPAAIAPTSQGWLGVNANGVMDWTDLRRTVVARGIPLTLPDRAGDVTGGQHGDALADPPEQLVVVDDDGPHTVALGQVFETHVAPGAGLVCGRMDGWTIALERAPFGPYIAREPIPSVRVPRLTRPFAAGPFFATSNDPAVLALEPTGQRDTPGNIEVPVRATAEQLARVGRPMIAGPECVDAIDDARLLAVFVHIGGQDDPLEVIARLRPVARARGRGLVIYDDGGAFRDVIAGALEPGDVIAPRWYPEQGERLINLRRRLNQDVLRLSGWNVPILPAIATYDMGGWISPANLARLVALYADIAGDWPNIIGMLWFAWLRANGVAGHPFLDELLAEVVADVPGLPDWPTVSRLPKDDPMPSATPNHIDIVRRVFREHPDLVEANTHESCGRLTEFAVSALANVDPAFGLLSKRVDAGEKNFRGHGIDSCIYKTTYQVVDIISGAGHREDLANGVLGARDLPAVADWTEVPRREGNDWIPAIDTGPVTPIEPPPPPASTFPMAIALKRGDQYLRVDPKPVAGKSGDDRWPVFADRSQVGGHEEIELAKDGDHFVARFKEADRILCLTPDGTLETRAADAVGPWEQVKATEQPDGVKLLYRPHEGHVPIVLTLEVR